MFVCLVNLVGLHTDISGGVGQIARIVSNLLLDHAARHPNFQLIFAVNPVLKQEFAVWLGVDTATPAPYIVTTVTLSNFDEPATTLLYHIQPDVIISPVYGTLPFHESAYPDTTIPHIAFMPDAQVLDRPNFFDKEQVDKRRFIYEQLRKASHIVTASDYSAERLIHHLQLEPSQVTPVPLGSDTLRHIEADENAFRPESPYLLYPANTWKHKRHDLLLETMESIWQVRPELHLVLTGGRRVGGDESILAMIQSSAQETGKIHDLGYVTAAHLKALYRHAEALVFPSVYEGFAMPLVEAMSLDCPVICTDVTCIPQTVGDAAIKLLESHEANQWADAILNALPARRAELIHFGRLQAQKFTWERSIEAYQTIFQKFGIRFEPSRPEVRSAPAYELVPINASASNKPQQFHLSHHLKDLRTLYQNYESQRLASDAPRISQIPILGFFFRTLLRLRYSQKLDAARMEILNALLEHQEQLAAYIADIEHSDG